MKSIVVIFSILFFHLLVSGQIKTDQGALIVKTANGLLQGTELSGISEFKGVPFAQPPVGDLRWKEPQPVKSWEGTRKADHFAAKAMQLPIYSDMVFRSDGMSEDCLYLNIWTPSKTGKEELPVLVYFYGGGFNAGDGSEFRYDGENMARRGIIAVTVNYRLGVFGFLAHPDLTKESSHHASGNYGLMDQTEALRWVRKNIAAFGGNPENITIAGESAGSTSVNAQIVSPLARNLFAGAIGESGSAIGSKEVVSLRDAETLGVRFSDSLGVHSIRELRAVPAQQILQEESKPGLGEFPRDVDGYFFPESPLLLYESGNVAKVPLMVGWNSGEGNWRWIFGQDAPTMENYFRIVRKLYPKNADEILKVYSVKNDSEVEKVATALAGDGVNGFRDWKWAELHTKTNSPVYRYYYIWPRPGLRVEINSSTAASAASITNPGTFIGASHSSEIEYALGNLPGNRVYDWQPADYLVSAVLQGYFLNFIKTKNPNGVGLPYWPLYQTWQKDPIQFIGTETRRHPDDTRSRYLYLDKMSGQ